jgi:chromosome segregation ATPase
MDGQKNLLRALKIEELRSRSEVICNLDSQVNSSNIGRPKDASSAMESEILETCAVNIEWQVFSDVLRESHYTALDMIKRMQGRLYMLEKQLHDSNDSRESLVLKLNSALDQSKCLKESESGYILKCDDLTVKNQILEAKLQDIAVENALFMEKLVASERVVEEHKTCESKNSACTEERKKFENLLVKESKQTSQLKDELRSVMEDFEGMKDELRKQSSLINEQQIVFTSLQEQLSILCPKLVSLSKDIGISCVDEVSVLHELQNKNYTAVIASLEFFQQQACQKVLHLHHENAALEEMCDVLRKRADISGTELFDVKQKFHRDMAETKEKLNISEGHVKKLQQELQEMEHEVKIISESQEKHSITNGDLTSKLAQMEVELQIVISENETLVEKTKDIAAVVQELERTRVSLAETDEDNKTLAQSLQSKDELLVHMENEIRGLQNCLSCTEENLLKEKIMREDLESSLASLTSQLGEKDQVLLSYNEGKIELLHLRDQILDMTKENSLMQDALSQSEQNKRDLTCKNFSLHSQLSNAENQLATILEDLLATEIEASYMRSQVEDVAVQLDLLRSDIAKLQLENKDADELMEHMLTVAELADRNSTLESTVHSQEINLVRVNQEKEGLEELIKRSEQTLAQVSNNKSRDISASINNSEAVLKYQDEILQLRAMQINLEENVDGLRSMKDEVEILNVVLKSKLEEQHTEMSSLLQDLGYQLKNLEEQNNELTLKLAEETLKAEEFKNLSIHLRELKEKAEAGKKEKEGSLFAMQESLRIAFIKEQYESKVQELKSQVFVSKKYSEEMLLKLQSALDEVETGRKNEIALAKRIEELSMEVSELEVEMQDLSSEKRELSNAYDSIMTDLECTKLNFDCCKEEKQKIEASLQECSEERNRTRVELDLVKKLLENMSLSDHITSPRNSGSCNPGATSIAQILGDAKSGSAPELIPNTTEVNSGLQEGEVGIQSTHLSEDIAESDDADKVDEHPHAMHTPSKNLEVINLT